MAPIEGLKKARRSQPKLTTAQKETHRKRLMDLMEAINNARQSYQEAAEEIAETHGRQEHLNPIDRDHS